MAKEYITYEEYLSRARKQAEGQQSAYAAEREQSAEDAVKALNTAQEANRAQIQQETAQKIDAAKASYQALYDENAVREKTAQLNVAETLANMGLSDSGLNRTQQTALSAVRARADADVSLKKQQAVDALLSEMTAAIEKDRQSLKAAETAELAAAKEDIEQNRLALEKEAQTAATAQFNADLKAAEQAYEQTMQDKKFAQEVKEWQAEDARQKTKIKADIALQQQKARDEAALQAQKIATANASDDRITAAQKVELTESLRKALKERTEVYNEAMRADYDQLIAYYESLLY